MPDKVEEIHIANVSPEDCDRWQGTPLGSLGQHCGQAAPQWAEDRSRTLRSSQHFWRILSGEAYGTILLSNIFWRSLDELLQASQYILTIQLA